MNRWVLYERISVSDDASTAIVRQDTDLKALCELQGGVVVAVLVDDGKSGGKARAKADAALAMLANGEADTLAVWKLDRWTRQGFVGLAPVQTVIAARPSARFVTADGAIDTANGDVWEMIAPALAYVGKAERTATAARVKSAISHLRKSGRFPGGTVPYGYAVAPSPDGPGRVLVLDDDEAAIVGELADRLIAGESVWRLARELNERSIPAPRSEARRLAREGREGGDLGQWRSTSVRKVMTGDFLRGFQRHHGDLVRDTDGLPARVWPAVLDDARWFAVRDLLAPDPEYQRPQRRRAARLLSGTVSCGACEHVMYVRADRLSRGGAIYGCPGKRLGLVCPEVRIAAGSLEDHVLDLVKARVGDMPMMRREVSDSDSAAGALRDVEAAIGATTADMAEDDADITALAAQLAALKARRAELRAQPAERSVAYVETGETWHEAFTAAETVESQRALLADVVLAVRVAPASRQSGRFDAGRVAVDFAPAVATLATVPRQLIGEPLYTSEGTGTRQRRRRAS
jgi:DNA invertase Pin-like site-specific DNA recombinase